MWSLRVALLGCLCVLIASAPVDASMQSRLPEALRASSRALEKAGDEDFVTCLTKLLAADSTYRKTFSSEVSDPKTRKAALATIETVDIELAASIRKQLPEGVPEEATLRSALAPWFSTHVEAPLVDLLEDEVNRLQRSHTKRVKTLLTAVPALSANSLKKREKLVTEWSTARDTALAIILDEKFYPDGDYTETTQKPLDKRIRAVRLAYKKLAKSLDADLSKMVRKEPAEWNERRAQVDASAAAIQAVAPLLEGRILVAPPDPDSGDPERMRRVRGLVLIYGNAALEGRELLTGYGAYDEQLFARALALTIKKHNDKVLAAREGPQLPIEREVAHLIDEYRMVMGLVPLEYDQRLQQCALGHSSEMQSQSYFSHDSPNPERRTFVDRARLAAYPDPSIGEMIYKGTMKTEAKDVFMVWFYSALHHRLMLRDWWVQVGIARADQYFTLNFGKVNAVER